MIKREDGLVLKRILSILGVYKIYEEWLWQQVKNGVKSNISLSYWMEIGAGLLRMNSTMVGTQTGLKQLSNFWIGVLNLT